MTAFATKPITSGGGLSSVTGRTPSPMPQSPGGFGNYSESRRGGRGSGGYQPAGEAGSRNAGPAWSGPAPTTRAAAPNMNSRDPFGDQIRTLREEGYEYDPGYLAAQWQLSGYTPPSELSQYTPQALAASGVRPNAVVAPPWQAPGGMSQTEYVANINRPGARSEMDVNTANFLRDTSIGAVRILNDGPGEEAERQARRQQAEQAVAQHLQSKQKPAAPQQAAATAPWQGHVLNTVTNNPRPNYLASPFMQQAGPPPSFEDMQDQQRRARYDQHFNAMRNNGMIR